MNNENQTNQNMNNGGYNATSLGAAPTPTPVPNNDALGTPNPSVAANNNVLGTPTPSVAPNNDSMGAPIPNAEPNNMASNPLGKPVNNNPVPPMPNPEPVAPNPSPMPSGVNENNLNMNTPNGGEEPLNQPGMNPNPAPINNNLGPIEQPIPGTTGYTAGNTNSNAFVETKRVENFGIEPPKANDKPKKGMNKVLFIIIIVVLLAAIAFGVYYYLSLGQKSKISVTTKNLDYNVNQLLSSNITDYATIEGTDPKNCSLDLSSVDNKVEGTYQYTIKCSDEKFTGNITIINNTLPSATTKEVYTAVGTSVNDINYTPEDFILENSCTSNGCTYTFAENVDFSTYLGVAGNYPIKINVTDSAGKIGTVDGTLVVLKEPVRIFLNCTKEMTAPDTGTITDSLAMGAQNYAFINYAYRVSEFKFASSTQYNEVAGSKEATLNYNGVEGVATYDDDALTISIKTTLTDAVLNSEAGGTFPTNYSDVGSYYQTKGYTCRPQVVNQGQ